jgi:hypothetical protein
MYGMNNRYLSIENCTKSNLKIIVVSGLFIMWALTSFVFASKTELNNNNYKIDSENSSVSYVQRGEVVKTGVETSKMIKKISNYGFSPEVVANINREFFSAEGQIITLGNSNIKVFEYRDNAKLLEEVNSFRESASTPFGSWKKNVHLYRDDNLIVFYMGNEKGIIESLDGIFIESVVL